MMAGSVKAIDKQSVHRICSGQVVLNLATAVKELVENALDAGASNIDIRLKEYGSEILEVTDNGSGVEENNFQGLTLKHHTSKLKDFSDLNSVDTFGFRGEALSSLCALSDMTITTCHESVSVGTRLEYDHNGKLIKQTPSPRQHGTTVTLQNLFSTLPVRHKEFLRNLKKEFTKMVQLLQAYGIISSGVKLTCTNQVGQGKRSPVLTTSGNALLKENIANVFGPKQLHSLMEFSQALPNAEQCEEYGLKEEQLQTQIFKLTGYVSKSDHGQGRSSADRQYYYINRRPCDFLKVSKLVNEVYHTYNRHQYPVVILDISLAKDSVDVNVTPDKRKIFVLEEKSLLAMLKASLHQMFEPRSNLYDMNSQMKSSASSSGRTETGGMSALLMRPSLSKSSPVQESKVNYKGLKVTLAGLKRSFSHSVGDSPDHEVKADTRLSKQPRLDGFLLKKSTSEPAVQQEAVSTIDDSSCHHRTSDPVLKLHSGRHDLSPPSSPSESRLKGVCDKETPSLTIDNPDPSSYTQLVEPSRNCTQSSDRFSESQKSTVDLQDDCKGQADHCVDIHSDERDSIRDSALEGPSMLNGSISPQSKSNYSGAFDETPTDENSSHGGEQIPKIITMDDSSFQANTNRREVQLPFSMEALYKSVKDKQDAECEQRILTRMFKATITPSDNNTAEEELQKHVSKDMFPRMEILGQFNLGFIIAKLDSDLFIIDQHATDEKYNFEMLQRHTALQGQRLIQPMPLELTAVNESILLDNLEIFKKNGFDFSIDEEALPTKRVKLTSLPTSKNWTFGKEDIDEVIFMLSDSPGVMCRPSRVRQMFASRACRKSIMIGTALDHLQMRKLLNHMADIDQPWNCPHGRPTMRHLFNLDMLPD